MSDLPTRLREQFDAQHTVETDGCWLWTGPRVKTYGIIRVLGGQIFAHRFSYEMFIGAIGGLDVHHCCHVRLCVNPDHLRLMSHRDNLLLSNSPPAQNARKTHCKRGHPFNEENTYVERGSSGRQCRKCRRARDRKRGTKQRPVL